MLNKQKLIDALEILSDRVNRIEHDPAQSNGIDRAIVLISGFPDDDSWVPITERLPGDRQNVWATNEYRGGSRRVEKCFYKDGEFYETGYSTCEIICTHLVKAWCPRFVPEPYKEVSEE